MLPVDFYKALADETRLRCLILIQQERELCVCELVTAMGDSQPKISRHLAQLRTAGILSDRRQGQWVFYQINPTLPNWAATVINQTHQANIAFIAEQDQRLQTMGERPERIQACC
ncbi:MAG: ArsR family transcriptional regulator [Pseudohongiellaceae bacterium]|jgi:ArsR family transcriptional regulator